MSAMCLAPLEAEGILGGGRSLESFLAFCGVASLDELEALNEDEQLTLEIEGLDERAA